jgi:hypothetical protein
LPPPLTHWVQRAAVRPDSFPGAVLSSLSVPFRPRRHYLLTCSIIDPLGHKAKIA